MKAYEYPEPTGGPASGDLILATDISDSNKTVNIPIEDLPISTAQKPIPISCFYPSALEDLATLLIYNVVAYPFSIPAACTGSVATAETAATGSTVISLKKNGTEFGTITFAAAGTTGIFAATSETSFAVNDKLSIVGPATADATLAGIAASLKGEKA